MSRQQIALSLTSAAGPARLVLNLDPARMSQRILLEHLGKGVLFEPETSLFFANVLRPGDAFIDIGAHVGYFTLLGSILVGSGGRVFAFEPDATNHEHLLEHIEVNGATHVLPVRMAVGAEQSVAEFYVNADNDGGHALWDVGQHPFNERSRSAPDPRKVFVTSLDGFFGERGPGSLKAIKIDAEGAEVSILRGARALLERCAVPFVVAEVNRFGLQAMGTSEEEMRTFMTSLGYEVYVFVPGKTQLMRLRPDQRVETDYVFNLLFRRPEAPAFS